MSSVNDKKGFVYLIGVRESKRVKIGKANSLKKRLKALQTASPFELEVISSFASSDPLSDEMRLHKHLAQYRAKGEWFDLPSELLEDLSWFAGISNKHFSKTANKSKTARTKFPEVIKGYEDWLDDMPEIAQHVFCIMSMKRVPQTVVGVLTKMLQYRFDDETRAEWWLNRVLGLKESDLFDLEDGDTMHMFLELMRDGEYQSAMMDKMPARSSRWWTSPSNPYISFVCFLVAFGYMWLDETVSRQLVEMDLEPESFLGDEFKSELLLRFPPLQDIYGWNPEQMSLF